jgi:hypothetical protein
MTEQEIYDIYPEFFSTNAFGDPIEDYKPHIGVGKGWWPLVKVIVEAAKRAHLKEPYLNIYRTDIKEKFGQLRVYVNYDNLESLSLVIEDIESLSLTICEECGNTGVNMKRKGWYRTLCPTCEKNI